MKRYLILIVDDEGSQLLYPPPVPHLSLSGAHALRLVDLVNVGPSLDLAKEDDCLLGLGVALNLVCDDKGDLGNVLDLVT
jgi:hypothetical protein